MKAVKEEDKGESEKGDLRKIASAPNINCMFLQQFVRPMLKVQTIYKESLEKGEQYGEDNIDDIKINNRGHLRKTSSTGCDLNFEASYLNKDNVIMNNKNTDERECIRHQQQQ